MFLKLKVNKGEEKMEENNIIICEKCYEENEGTRSTCKKCGAKLYKNVVEKGTKEYSDTKKTTTKKDETIVKENAYKDSSNSSNRVADKFVSVVIVSKFLGYLAAIISMIHAWRSRRNFHWNYSRYSNSCCCLA